MTVQTPDAEQATAAPPEPSPEPSQEPSPNPCQEPSPNPSQESAAQAARGTPPPPPAPKFILYLEAPEYGRALRQLTLWVHHVLLPVYGREVTSMALWCSRWWEHPEAVAQLHGLWLAWGELSDTGSESGLSGPASWHRDFLGPIMQNLRDPSGVFAGCKPGAHRPKEVPAVDAVDPFGPPPGPRPAQG